MLNHFNIEPNESLFCHFHPTIALDVLVRAVKQNETKQKWHPNKITSSVLCTCKVISSINLTHAKKNSLLEFSQALDKIIKCICIY